jgi:hypothetical protein
MISAVAVTVAASLLTLQGFSEILNSLNTYLLFDGSTQKYKLDKVGKCT